MDATLLERAQKGDRAALEDVLEELAPLVFRYGTRMCGRGADAEDVLQDTLLSIADHLPEFEGRSSLSSWVFTLVRTACTRRRRGLKNQAHLSDDAVGERASEDASPEDAAEARELGVRLEAALASLREEHREVLILRDMEGLSAKEVADALGTSVDAVKSRLHRARAALREAFAPTLEAPVAAAGACPDVVDALSRKLEGDLDALDCERFEAHVAGCPRCNAACSALRGALGACRAAAHGPVPEAVRARVRAAVQCLEGHRLPG